MLYISVEMKRKKQTCNFGYEMTVRFRNSEPLPHIVEINHEDNAVVKDIKQLILQMTGFRDRERPRISAVIQRLQEIKGKTIRKIISHCVNDMLQFNLICFTVLMLNLYYNNLNYC